MKRALVTGASGFIGRHCIASLSERGFEIHAITSQREPGEEGPTHWHHADLLRRDDVRTILRDVRPTHLLHLAWLTEPRRYRFDPENVDWFRATAELFERFGDVGGERAVFGGSCAEYDSRYGHCVEDVTPIGPVDLYGQCKVRVSEWAMAARDRLGFSYSWGRVFFPYGPHGHPDRLIGSVIRSLLAGGRAQCTTGEQLRDFIFVQDVGDAFSALLDSTVSGPVNVGSGEPVTVKGIILRIAQALGAVDRIDLGCIPLTPGEPTLLVADVQKLRTVVGFTPRYPLDQGVEMTVNWWRRQEDS